MGWLKEFYDNPSQNAAAFQFLVFDSHVDVVEAAMDSGKQNSTGRSSILLIIERGMLDQLLFWKQQVDAGHASASPLYDAAYTRIWNKWNRFVPTPSLMILMYTSDLQSTMKRVKARARAEELGQSTDSELSNSTEPIKEVNGLTVDYQEKLLKKHLEWFTEPIAKIGQISVPCVHLNVDTPYHKDQEALKEMARTVAEYIIKFITF